MTEEDFKKLFSELLKPLSKDLSGLKQTQEEMKMVQEEMKISQEEIKQVQENQVLPSVVTIEKEIKVYSDMYKMNNDNIIKLDKRMNIAEEELGIETPEELVLGSVR